MLTKKNLLLTFDYELFLGSRSGTVDNCIIIPTTKILQILKSHNISHAIFFVDTTYLITLKNNTNQNCQTDFIKISSQIQEIKNAGHYVFPHLHPHWLNAKYLSENNQWDLSNMEKYSFFNLSEEERKYMFLNSIKILEEIIGVQTDWGYRAGGWCIQPFSDFKPFFEQHNIKYDFSVLKGYKSVSKHLSYNFLNTPLKNYYRFNEDVLLDDINGKFIEIPISNIRVNILTQFINKIFIKILYRKGITNYGNGLSASASDLKESFPIRYSMVSLELLTLINISNYIKNFEKKDFLHFISHPKMLNPHNLTCLDAFLKKILSKYKVNTDFKEMIS